MAGHRLGHLAVFLPPRGSTAQQELVSIAIADAVAVRRPLNSGIPVARSAGAFGPRGALPLERASP